MPVDLDELEGLFADWRANETPATFLPLDDALYRDAPSLIAELREARARIVGFEILAAKTKRLLEPFARAVYNDNGDLTVATPKTAGYGFYCDAYFVHDRAARLIQPAKETP